MEPKAREPIVYWHRELPPTDAHAIGSHTIEVISERLPATVANRRALWDRSCRDLMSGARARIEQEVARRGADYARVVREWVEPHQDERSGDVWMYGRFDYELYRRYRLSGATRESQ